MFKYALVAATVLAVSVGPRTVAAQRDSVILDLAHRDSSSHLTLTPRYVVFQFTRDGVQQIRRHVDSTSTTFSPWLARVVSQSVAGAMRGIRIAFDYADIESAEADGATVRLRFWRTHSNDDKFEFDAADAASARQFVRRLNDLLSNIGR